jgi:heptosyltransferase III
MTFCIFRTDRIGDVLLTLPLAAALKRHDPSMRVLFCAREYTAALLRLSPDIDEVIAIPEQDVPLFSASFVTRLRELQIDCAVFAFPRPGLALAAARAGIPVRVATAFRWYSPLFTHRRKEHRRGGGGHERDYNLGLLQPLGIDIADPPVTRLCIPEALDAEARSLLASIGIDAASRFVVLHPGSGGSAKDWPPETFGELASGLLTAMPDVRVLVTGTSKESALVQKVLARAGEGAAAFTGDIPLQILAAVLARAGIVVANSTGPLHIASAVGRPVIGLYPFLHQCHPRRWGPLGVADVFTPDAQVGCPRCANENCDEHDDMRRIAVKDVLARAIRRLGL